MKAHSLREGEQVQDAKEILAENARLMRKGKRKLASADLPNAICQSEIRMNEEQNGQNSATVFEGTLCQERKKTRTDSS